MAESGKRAVVLCSGGLDSTTCMGLAVSQGFRVTAVTFDYGQRHRVEVEAAARVARHYEAAPHLTVENPLFRMIGGSALTAELAVPHGRSADGMADGGIPVTYVPARNLVFLSQAVAIAEVVGASDIFVGVNAIDYSGYPDCRPEFIDAFEAAARLATRQGVEGAAAVTIRAPLIDLSKAEIIRRGLELDVPYHLTHSCYDPGEEGHSCGDCDSCTLRLEGFAAEGVPDPIAYVAPGIGG